MSIEENLRRGDEAKQIIESEVFAEAFNSIESELIEQWKTSPARDAAGRESIWTYLQIMQKFRAHLTSTMETGKLAQLEMQHRQTLWERSKEAARILTG